MLRGCGEGEVLGWSEVAVVGDDAVPGERLEDLARDGAFKGAGHGADRPTLLEMPVSVVSRGGVVRHADFHDVVQCRVCLPVAAANDTGSRTDQSIGSPAERQSDFGSRPPRRNTSMDVR